MVTILFFGSLTDTTAVNELMMDAIADTEQLQVLLHEKFPALQSAKYFIALNQQMIQEKTVLQNGDTVALMPPFSGG